MLAIALAAGGCATATKQTIDPNTVTALKNQTVAKTERPAPDFAASTPGKAAFGMIGATMMISAGNAIVAENELVDPADRIAAALLSALSEAHGVKALAKPAKVSALEPEKVVAAADTSANYVLDVRTHNWSFIYFPTNFTRYRVMYSVNARLIDAKRKAVVAEGFCARIPKTVDGAPTYDELLKDKAALIKLTLSTAADECVQVLKAEMLSMPAKSDIHTSKAP
jgi:hypothetical protein